MYAKNVAFPSGFLCNSLLKKKQKNSILRSIKFLDTLFLENEEKTSETKIDKCFPITL